MDDISRVKEAIDLHTIIGEKVKLTPSGKYSKGLCPFHGERTPSFFVSPEMQSYKCFGCGRSGDVFTFLQEYEGMTFREALEVLAQRAGIKLSGKRNPEKEDQTKKLYSLLNLARDFYHYLLMEHPSGAKAREYLKSRQTPKWIWKEYQLGYAPSSWEVFKQYAVNKKGFDLLSLEKSGLLIPNNRGGYDRFRNRLVFPLTDFRGRVVGFSGRLLSTEAKEAKYINTPETQLYHKRELLYGLSQAKQAIRKKDEVVLVEGEFDVLSSVAAGVKQTVGIKGSAVTKEHLEKIIRLCKRVVLCLDADAAGDQATKKAIKLADDMGVVVSIVPLKGAKDPDEIAREDAEEWKQLVKSGVSAYQYYIDTSLTKYDPETGEGLRAITKEVIPVLAQINNKVEQTHYLQTLAKRIKVRVEVVEDELVRYQQSQQLGVETDTRQEDVGAKTDDSETGLMRSEESLVAAWLQMPPETRDSFSKKINQLYWAHPRLSDLIDKLIELWDQGLTLEQIRPKLEPQMQQLLTHVYLDSKPGTEVSEADLTSLIDRVYQKQLKYKIQQLGKQVSELEDNPEVDPKQLDQLRQELTRLIQERQNS